MKDLEVRLSCITQVGPNGKYPYKRQKRRQRRVEDQLKMEAEIGFM